MQLYESRWMCVVGLTHQFALSTIPHFSLWCQSARVFLSGCILLYASMGQTSFPLPCVRTPIHLTWLAARSNTFFRPKSPYLSVCTTTIKELHYHPLLGLLLQTVWGLVGTSYRGDPLECWWFQHCQHDAWTLIVDLTYWSFLKRFYLSLNFLT